MTLRRLTIPFTIVAVLAGSAISQAGSVPFASLPLPVKAYVLKTAVEYGVEAPENIRSNDDYDDRIPGLSQSDLNGDGARDFAVALCMFNESVRQFWTNGYPCSVGTLMISNGYGGYQFMLVAGLLVSAKAGETPVIVVRERQLDGACDDYVCDVEYRLQREEGMGDYTATKLRACLPDQC